MRQQVEEAEKTLYARRQRQSDHYQNASNAAGNEEARDAIKQASELKLKLQEAERENTSQQGNVRITFNYYSFFRLYD